MAHTFNPSTPEAETGRSLSSRPAWSTEFQDSQSYTEKAVSKNQIIIITIIISYNSKHYVTPSKVNTSTSIVIINVSHTPKGVKSTV